MLKYFAALTLAAMTLTDAAHAQATAGTSAATTAAAPTAASPAAPISPEKEKLIHRVLELWHVENVGVIMLQRPVFESIKQSRSLMQGRVPQDVQDAAMKDIGQYTKKFMDDVTPVVQASAKKLIPATVVPILAEKFSEDELRQIIAILESPVKSKFEALAPDMERALGEKIAADSGAAVNPKMNELTQEIGMRMRSVMNQ